MSRHFDNAAIESAKRTLRAAYYAEIKRSAKALHDEIKSEQLNREDAEERIRQAADDAVIYNVDQYDAIYASDNESSAAEALEDIGIEFTDWSTYRAALAMQTYVIDLTKEIERLPPLHDEAGEFAVESVVG